MAKIDDEMDMSQESIEWTPPRGKVRDGFEHYFQESDGFFGELIANSERTATIADFDQAFNRFETNYFQNMPDHFKGAFEREFPADIRIMSALNRYTK